MASVFFDKRSPGRPWIVKWRTPEQRHVSFASEGSARAFGEFIADQSRRGPSRTALPTTARERIESRIVRDEGGCWRWQGYISKDGYSQITFRGESVNAHRLSYETFVGPIPVGFQIDHLCRIRDCVNPEHLEPVTPRENVMRSPIAQAALNAAKTECAQGHPYDDTNTYVYRGTRICKACARAHHDNYRARRTAQKAS